MTLPLLVLAGPVLAWVLCDGRDVLPIAIEGSITARQDVLV